MTRIGDERGRSRIGDEKMGKERDGRMEKDSRGWERGNGDQDRRREDGEGHTRGWERIGKDEKREKETTGWEKIHKKMARDKCGAG